MPNDQGFEKELEKKINKDFKDEKARLLKAAYDSARSELAKQIYCEIKGQEPNLSDHSNEHISNVLDNAYALLEEDGAVNNLSGIEMYCLGMIILFHDVGNLYGRENHQTRIAKIYDQIRGTNSSVRPEKTLVLKAARAHTGKALDGSYDTLKDLGQNEHLEGKQVRLRDLASVLRFADELAEGPQRTSSPLSPTEEPP